MIVTVALLLWPNTARVIRAQVLSLRERAWVEAARVTGCSTGRIMFVHVLPQVLPLAALYGSVAIGWAILAEAAASFLGLRRSGQHQLGRDAAERLRQPGTGARGVELVRATWERRSC